MRAALLARRLRPAVAASSPARSLRPPTARAVVAMAGTGPNGETLDKNTSEDVWKKLLTAEEYYVLRQKGTEPPGSGPLNKHYADGEYKCAGCGALLFTSDMKFDSGCGWPAFWDEVPGSVNRIEDNSMGMRRVEITCAQCDGHLGHVFEGEGFPNPKNQRHCVNSISIKFTPK